MPRVYSERIELRVTPEQKEKLHRISDAREESIAVMFRAWIDGMEDMPVHNSPILKRRSQ